MADGTDTFYRARLVVVLILILILILGLLILKCHSTILPVLAALGQKIVIAACARESPTFLFRSTKSVDHTLWWATGNRCHQFSG